MAQFKTGDRVEYVGNYISHLGNTYVIESVISGHATVEGESSFSPKLANLRLITPAPPVITIDRADLPEVKWDDGDLLTDRGTFGSFVGAAHYRNAALTYLALAEFLEARETAAKEAEQKAKAEEVAMLKRRDELAREMYLEAFGKNDGVDYRNRNYLTQLCIDRIIELTDKLENTK